MSTVITERKAEIKQRRNLLTCNWIVVIATATALAIAGCAHKNGGSSGSDQDEMFAEMLEAKFSITMDSDVAGEMARTACNGPLAGVGYYNALKAMEQRYPEYSPNTVSTVMSQGVLAYCPGRLP